MQAAQRLHGLDFLRGSMMLLGIALHGGQMYMTMTVGFDYYRDPVSSPVMDGLLIFINTFRMPVFFFISGFFTAMLYERYGLGDMLRNRWRRIVLPFVLILPPLSLLLGLQWIMASQLMATGSVGFDVSYVPYPRLLYDNTHHLWFLYYLMFHLAAMVLLIGVWHLCPRVLAGRLRALGLQVSASGVPIIVLLGLVGGALALPHYFGRVSGNIRFEPYLIAVSFFFLCFIAGWAFWYRRDELATLERRCWTYLGIATAALGVALYAFFNQGDYGGPTYALLHPLLALSNGISVAFYVVGFTGLFSRYCSDFNPVSRYLSDSAYWVYILHQSALILFALPLFHWQLPAEVKFLIVCAGTTVLCLVTYDRFVRDTWLGALLNGRRYPRGLPGREVPAG